MNIIKKILSALKERGAISENVDVDYYSRVMYEPRFGSILFYMDRLKTKKEILDAHTKHVTTVMERIAGEQNFLSKCQHFLRIIRILTYFLL